MARKLDKKRIDKSAQLLFGAISVFIQIASFCSHYTDTFNLIVVSLNQIELATDEDKTHEIDKWAKLFKSKTWEELKMVANGNEYMTSAVETVFLSNENKEIAKVARERDDYLRHEAWRENEIKKLGEENEKLKDEQERLIKENADQAKKIAELEAKLEANNKA